MPVRLDRSSADFDARFAQFLAAKREVSADVEASARAIVDDVAARGDAALIEATQKFDRLTLEAKNLRIGAAEIEAAVKACDATTLDALKFARDRIETFHAGSCRGTSASPTLMASSSAGAGARSRPSASMCPAAPRPIRRRS